MRTQTTLLFLLGWAWSVVAFPGYSSPSQYPPPPSYSASPPHGTCSAIYITRTNIGSSTSTYVTTKTTYVPLTISSGRPDTTISSFQVTNVDTSTKTITSIETSLATKTYPVTTVVYTTVVEEVCNTTTIEETFPYTSIYTSYITDVTTCPIEIVTSTPVTNVCSETTTIPYSSTVVETFTVCPM